MRITPESCGRWVRRQKSFYGGGWFLYNGSAFERTAIHEAAHAVFCEINGRQVDLVSIRSSPDRYGFCMSSRGPGSSSWDQPNVLGNVKSLSAEGRRGWREFCRRTVEIHISGPIAATRVWSKPINWGHDLRSAVVAVNLCLGLDFNGMRQYLRQEEARLAEAIRAPEVWRAIAALARELQFRGTIRVAPGESVLKYNIAPDDWLLTGGAAIRQRARSTADQLKENRLGRTEERKFYGAGAALQSAAGCKDARCECRFDSEAVPAVGRGVGYRGLRPPADSDTGKRIACLA